jgi:hypothetical protein
MFLDFLEKNSMVFGVFNAKKNVLALPWKIFAPPLEKSLRMFMIVLQQYYRPN